MKAYILTFSIAFIANLTFSQNCEIFGPAEACTNQSTGYYANCQNADGYQWQVNGSYQSTSSTLDYAFPTAGTYEIILYYSINGNFIADPTYKYVTVYDAPVTPIIQANTTEFCNSGNVTLTITNEWPGTTFSWYSVPSGFSGTGNPITFNNVTQSTQFFVSASNVSCQVQSSLTIDVVQTTAFPDQDAEIFYRKKILHATPNSSDQQWHYWQISASGTEITRNLVGDYTVTANGNYYSRRRSTIGNCWTVASTPINVTVGIVPPLPVVNQVSKAGYNEIFFTESNKAHVLTFADVYWVNDASSNPEIMGEFIVNNLIVNSKIYSTGSYYLKAKDRATGTWGPTLTLNVQLRGDEGLNWIHTKAFDGTASAVAVSESKGYFDESGKPLQSQTKSFEHDYIFATQSLKDTYDRTVGSTLPAPIIPKTFTYNSDFLLDGIGETYSPDDFDEPENKYSPNPVGTQQPGTVGWYYSGNNNLEDHVPTTHYPYSRTEFYEDGTGEVKRSASPGDYHRLGMGHEVLSGTFPVFNELDDYIARRTTALPGIVQDNSLRNEGMQSIARDENGKYVIAIADKSGKGVMTARNGSPTDYGLKVDNVVTSNADEASPNYRKMTYFYILNSQPVSIAITGEPTSTLYGGTITKSSYSVSQNKYVASTEIRLLPGFEVTGGNTFNGSISYEGQGWVVENIVTGEILPPYQTFADSNGNWPVGFYRLTMLTGEVTISYSNYYLDVSYQFYDDMGRLKTSVSPNGFKAWKSGTAYSAIDKTTYNYNFQGWLLSMTEPDAGTTSYKYRRDGKIRFSQNAQQDIDNRFSYTHYDNLGRPVESGEYKGTLYNFDNLSTQLELEQQVIFGSGDIKDWVKTYYDIPDPNLYTATGLPTTFTQEFVRGAVSYTENANMKTWYSYDELGRVTWMAQKPTGLTRVFVSKYEYDFLGNVLMASTLSYEGVEIREQFHHHYEYDADKRLAKAFTSVDGTNKKLRANYEYYLHGPLKRIELGGMIVNDEVVSEIQGIDFVYNINGWLTQINHPNQANDPGGDSNDAFGMVLDYYESEMEGLFPTAMNTKDFMNPELFHQLPNEFRESSHELAFTPKPAFEGSPSWTENLKMIQDYYSNMKSVGKPNQKDAERYSVENPSMSLSEIAPVNFDIDNKTLSVSLKEGATVMGDSEKSSESTMTLISNHETSLNNSAGVITQSSALVKAFSPPPPIDIVWTYATGVSVSGNTITKTAANGWGSGGASSQNKLAPFTDGWIEMTVPSETGKEKMFGLADHDIDVNYTAIDYAFYINSNINVYENGSNKGAMAGGPAVAGEVLRIERIGNIIYYKRNGITVYTSATLSTSHLIADAAINQTGGRVSGATASFGTADFVFDIGWMNLVGVTANGNTVTKTAANGWGNAGATSFNQLPANRDGWIEFTYDAINQQRSFGFSDVNTDANYNTIDYAIYTNASSIYVHLNGVNQRDLPAVVGDVFRIERVGSTINFKKNGTIIHTVTSALTGVLFADCAIAGTGVKISNAKASFWTLPSEGFVPDLWELNALKQLYDSVGGAAWTNKTNWPAAGSWPASATAATMDTWYGITTSGGDLTYIQMANNNMIGKLPASIGNLTMLSRLELNSNKLNGLLTPSIGNLIRMNTLFLHTNDLSGSVPTAMANLKQLTELDLRSNLFTGTFPQFLNQFTKIRWLYVGENRTTGFTGSIPDLTGLTAVTHIIIRSNPNLTPGPVPASIGNLPTLISVLMNNNKFQGVIPENWQNLTAMTTLDLSNNSITAIPNWIGAWTSMQSLSIRTAGLTGSIPASVGLLTNLKWLYLDVNQLSGKIPDQLNGATKLIYLYLNNNQLSGEVPALNNLVDMEYFQLNSNALTGTIGSWIGSMPKLKTFRIDYNQFTDVSAQILQLPLMTNVYLNNNALTSVPNFFTYSNKINLNLYVANNYLDFSDLEPLFGTGVHGIKTFSYNVQKKFNGVTKKHVPAGNILQLDAQPKGQYSTVTWEKQNGGTWPSVNASNEDATQQTFKISNATSAVNGNYRWRMTNTRVTGLTLECDPIEVLAVDALPAQPGEGALFNGIIAAMRWRTDEAYGTGAGDLNGMYQFKYDDKYQIEDANWADPNHALTTFTTAGNKFRVTNLAYDPNGNIKSMNRYDGNALRTNNFAYTYKNSLSQPGWTDQDKNQLLSVSGYTNAYTYNAIGQMTAEDKTTGGDQYVEYDVTGKVVKVFDAPAKTAADLKVEYLYDDRGFRLAKKNFDAAGALILTTWYIRDAGGNVLSIYEQEPGQGIVQTEIPVYGSGKLATVYPQQSGSAAYEITDHLGNVRALVKEQVTVYTATMEDNGQTDITNPRVQELAYFENLFETEVNDPNMNHTPEDATIIPNPSKAAYLYWVGGTPGMDAIDKSVGPAIALQVNAGDTVKAEAYVRYRNETSFTRSGFTLGVLSSILGNSFAFTGGFDAANIPQTTQSFNNALTSGGFLGDGVDDTRPYAYLNYIVMDANYNRVSSGWQRVTEAAEFFPGEEGLPDMHEKITLSTPVVIGPTGKYIYVWVSNESQGARVWFDDVTVTHTTTYVAQATDYGVWGDVVTEQRSELEDKYRFGYQGQFAEKDDETGWNHFEAREYDPIVGKWTSIDPMRQYWSPYIGMGNNPISGVDADGKFSSKFMAGWYAFWHGGGDIEQVIGGERDGEWYVGNSGKYVGEGAGSQYNRVFDWGIEMQGKLNLDFSFGVQGGYHLSSAAHLEAALMSWGFAGYQVDFSFSSSAKGSPLDAFNIDAREKEVKEMTMKQHLKVGVPFISGEVGNSQTVYGRGTDFEKHVSTHFGYPFLGLKTEVQKAKGKPATPSWAIAGSVGGSAIFGVDAGYEIKFGKN